MKRIEDKVDEKGFRRIWEYEIVNGYEYDTYCGLVDKSGQEVIPCKYQNILGFFNGQPLSCVQLNGKWGYINEEGREVVPCIYDFAEDRFYCGLATVEKDGKWGAINSVGQVIVPCKYDKSIIYHDNLAGTRLNGKCGCVDTKGNIIISFKYDYASVMGQNRICVKLNGKYGLIDYRGNQITSCIYDGISDIMSGNRIEYLQGSVRGFMDLEGNTIQVFYAG